MNFVEHTKRNWLITLFAALFIGSTLTMIFLNEPRETLVVFTVLVASVALIFLAVIFGWYLIKSKKAQRAKTPTTT